MASSLLVLAVAVAFDLAADEPPTHALTVGLVAGVVGLGRIWVNGRHRGLFVLVNLAVLGQPVLHAMEKLAHAGADMLAPGHEWPQPLTGVVVHGAVALFLVAVAASEPIVFAVAVTAMRALLRFAWTLPSPSAGSPSRPRRGLGARAKGRRRLDARHARRRGPPVAIPLAV